MREPNVPVDANNADVIRGVFMMPRSSMISRLVVGGVHERLVWYKLLACGG